MRNLAEPFAKKKILCRFGRDELLEGMAFPLGMGS